MIQSHTTTMTSNILLLVLVTLLFGVSYGIPLLGGKFVTINDVTGILDFSLDIAAMEETADNHEEREEIYKNGRNAYIFDPITQERKTISLSSLSLNISSSMDDSMSTDNDSSSNNNNAFLVYSQRFFENLGILNGEDQGLFKGRPTIEYADTIVSELFAQRYEAIYETEAILILNVWMAVVDELYQVVNGCYRHHSTDTSLAALDNAIALWVGSGQSAGSNDDGYMLYWLAEEAAARFGQEEDDEVGEGFVNRQIIDIANSLQTDLMSEAGQLECSPRNDDDESESTTNPTKAVRDKVHEILDIMSIPLIQNALYHFSLESSSGYEILYSYAVLPRISVCDPNTVDQLLSNSILSTTTTKLDIDQTSDWVHIFMGTLSCFRLTCGDIIGESAAEDQDVPKCTDVDASATPSTFAGYTTKSPDAQLFSYIDRDIFQMQILMQWDAFDAALDLYRNGYNSRHAPLDLVLNRAIPVLPDSKFSLFQAYYNEETGSNDDGFIDKEIQAAFRGDVDYESASYDQRREIALGLLKYQVLYLSIESALQNSIQECKDGKLDSSIEFWDMGAAFFIGSLEGSARGGGSGGILLHGVSKQLCGRFGTCHEEESKSSPTNEAIIDAFSSGSDFIATEDCTASENLFNTVISPFLQIPLVQGTIAFGSDAAKLSENSEDGVIGKAHAFSRAILPFINELNENSAIVIDQNLRFNPEGESPMQHGIEAVANALRMVLPLEGTNCSDVGFLASSPSLVFCDDLSLSPNSTQMIAFGRYNFSDITKVDMYSSIALDIRDMRQAKSADDALKVYIEGANALRDNNGLVGYLTLSSFSTDAATIMSEDPMFNIYKYALYDEVVFDHPDDLAFAYANEIVLEALESTSDIDLAAEAAVVLNIWMMIAHLLYNTERSCRKKENAVEHLDVAVALWIGKDQSRGAFDGGWLLYDVAQEAARTFGFDETEAPVNEQLMAQFIELQSIVLHCPEDESVSDAVRVKISNLLRSFSIILVQRLLFSISADDRWHTELYASAVLSQCVGCNPDLHSDLAEIFYSDFSKDKIDEDVIEKIALFLRCIRVSCEDLQVHPDSSEELKDLVSSICQVMDAKADAISMLEYEPRTSVNEGARVDLDILHIGIFMRTGAFDTALDYYMHGQNSRTTRVVDVDSREFETVLTSLQELIQLPEGLQVDHFDTFAQYFESETYAEDILLQCLQRTGLFENATRAQLSETATRTLQAIVSYRAVVTKMGLSINACKDGLRGKASRAWDTGVAVFVGSINAYLSKVITSRGGTLHSLAMEQCQLFGSCQYAIGSDTTPLLMSQFQEGDNLLHDHRCDEVAEVVYSSILPQIQISFLQSLISEGFRRSSMSVSGIGITTSSDTPTGGAFIFAQSILPLIDASNEESAEIISRTFDSPQSIVSTPTEAEGVIGALKRALPGMGINCDEIGSLETRPDLSLCPQYPLPARFTNYTGFGLDVAAMRDALSSGEVEQARLIYSEGSHVQRSMPGETSAKYPSLQSLSTLATKEMTEEPVFNRFLFHFSAASDGVELSTYADTFVQQAFTASSENSATLAAEAAVVLNVWMYFIHSVYKSLEACREGLNEQEAIDALYEASAFWLGDISESNPNGNLLSALSQQMATQFELEFFPFNLNDEILGRLRETKNHLEQPGECTSESMAGSFDRRFELANEIASLATIPIMQGLILHLRTGDTDRSKLFATALIPLLSVCDQGDYEFLKAKLLDGDIDIVEVDRIIDTLYDSIPCLGLKCTQVGVHLSETAGDYITTHPRCEVLNNETSTIPGYTPESQFWKYATLDLDVREVNVLMHMEAYRAVRDILFYGKHSSTSVVSLASSPERSVIPFYDLYSDYFDSTNYGHDVVIKALENKRMTLSASQQRLFVVRIIQVLVMEHAALSMIYSSVEACESNHGITDVALWDAAAGLLIGSINRTKTTNSSIWFAPFDLAQEHCQEFGTCEESDSTTRIAEANKEMAELLQAGRGAAVAGSVCEELRGIADELSSLLLVPIIQATLSISIKLSSTSNIPTEEGLAEAFVFSRSILPRVRDVNGKVAASMEEMLTLKPRSVSKDTAESMFSLFHSVYEDIGVSCEAIGTAKGFDACMVPADKEIKDEGQGEEDNSSVWLVVGIIAGIVCLLAFAGGVYYWRRWHVSKHGTHLPRGSNALYTKRTLSYRESYRESKSLSSQASKKLDLILNYGDDENADGRSSVTSMFDEHHIARQNSTKHIDKFNGGDLGAQVMKEEEEEEEEEEDSSTSGAPSATGSGDDSDSTELKVYEESTSDGLSVIHEVYPEKSVLSDDEAFESFSDEVSSECTTPKSKVGTSFLSIKSTECMPSSRVMDSSLSPIV